ncbi:MAG: TonB-dependent receptor domain-containing protein [Chitinophagales bacterium]
MNRHKKHHFFKNFLFFLCFFFAQNLIAQNLQISGYINDSQKNPLPYTNVFAKDSLHIGTTADENGFYELKNLYAGKYQINFTQVGKDSLAENVVLKNKNISLNVALKESNIELNTLEVKDKQGDNFNNRRLRAVEGTAIYLAKKNEVVVIDQLTANLATNNSRQIYGKVAGLNIWESDGAGIQLGIGGRGLSPNRTANFNTRQNGYDISADALGYPESYYTPPSEAIEQIELVRGAASLQYGTQFGGLLNFKLKQAPDDKKYQIAIRQTIGSFGLYNNFNSIGGTVGKLKYYAFYQHKRAEGWRPNSDFRLNTAFASLSYAFSEKGKIGVEYTKMKYLAHQGGGLTDNEFNENPQQSNRERNWFQVDWNVFAVPFDYKFNGRTQINSRTFGLYATREALGFLGQISRTDPIYDETAADFRKERDLIYGRFRNFGNETRLLHRYSILNRPATFLVGTRYYEGNTITKQGKADANFDANFEFLNPDNLENSDYTFPSRNISAFSENIIYLTDKISVNPGLRYEYISNKASGNYRTILRSPTDEVYFDSTYTDFKKRTRNLVLLGIGLSYKPSENAEVYANFSQNYRAINFNDFKVSNPSFRIDEDLQDERGFNTDIGIRGKKGKLLTYDCSLFYLAYSNRIGEVQAVDSTSFTIYRYRTNIANAQTFGVESFAEIDLYQLFSKKDSSDFSLNIYANVALIYARYINSKEAAFQNKQVEFVPPFTLRTGVQLAYKDFSSSLQYNYTQQHFTDATNAEFVSSAIIGLVPSYAVMDFSLQYRFRFLKIETGINNLLNASYFTRRATGYPGPGILPSDARSFYVGVGFQF